MNPMGYTDAAAVLLAAVTLLAWIVVECRRSGVSVALRWPVRFR